MEEMMMEMIPMMMQSAGMPVAEDLKMAMMMNDKKKMMSLMSPELSDTHDKMMAMFKMKMMIGMQPGENEASLNDAMMKMVPQIRMMPESMVSGVTPQIMVNMMRRGGK